MSVRFVHAADIHLGSPLRALEGASPEMATKLSRATEVAFERIVSTAKARDVDFLVVAGDLYDREARSVRANQFLVDQFERLEAAGIPAYVAHGNHDPLGRGAEKLDLPDNVVVFGTDAVESAFHDDPDDPVAEVLGRSYGSRHEGTSYVDEFTPDSSGIPTVGVLHTALDPEDRQYVPCTVEDLAGRDIDYWALGHRHDPQTLEAAPAAYPGIPQPRHVGEPPVGGCLVVDLDVGETPDLEFVPTGSVVWQTVDVDVARLESNEDARQIANLTDLEGFLTDEGRDLLALDPDDFVAHDIPVGSTDWSPEGIICRWVLAGRGEIQELLAESDEGAQFLAERLRDRFREDDPFLWTEGVRDRTKPPLPARETLAEENDIVAELLDLTAELRADAEDREVMREKAGGAWELVEDPDSEETRTDRVPLTEERLDELLDEATEIAVTRLAATQYDVD